jgi:hypothetical protein
MRSTKAMKRTNIYLTDAEHKAIMKEAKRLGITAAEVVRRVLDQWIEAYGKSVNTKGM